MEIKKLEIKSDNRGSFVEIFKTPDGGQVSYSATKPGMTRGNHYHKRKKEAFCVIEGEAKIRQRNTGTDEIEEIIVSGAAPELVEMKLNWTHSIQNIGDKELKLLIWASEIFNPADPDTYHEEV